MAGRIVLFGASGYTGTLVAEELAARGVPAVLAGRSRERVAELAERLGGRFEVATADAARPGTVAELLGRDDVLLSTVGPFARVGDTSVGAAISAGAHYLDSAGEPSFMRRVFEEFGPRAESAQVVLLTGFGYDCVPGNVAGALAVEDAGSEARQVEIGYFSAGLRPSGGTLASLAGAVRAHGFAWREGRLVSERGGRRTASFDLGGRQRRGLSFGGTENIALPRTYPQLETVGTYLGWFGPATRLVSAMGTGQAALETVPGVRGVLDGATERLLKGSSGGPDATARARASATIAAVARDGSGRELATARLHGVDAYTLTARLLAWAACRLRDGVRPSAGARGPVEAFGLEVMTRALAEAGLPRVA